MPVLFLTLLLGSAAAHEESYGALQEVQKTWLASAPVGEIAVHYRDRADQEPTLQIRFAGIDASVPSEGLTDLPRPDWGRLACSYATTSFDPVSGGFVDKPYVNCTVPILGPAGKPAWESTWATFVVDWEGKLVRSVKRMEPQGTSIRVLWPKWPIGDGISAQEALRSAR